MPTIDRFKNQMNHDTNAKPAPAPPPKTLFAPYAIVLPLACIWLINATINTPIATLDPTQQHNSTGLRLDPNIATWTDLTLLPRIGNITAERIIAFREENRTSGGGPVFHSAQDLERVHGIGPVTVSKIEGFLTFD